MKQGFIANTTGIGANYSILSNSFIIVLLKVNVLKVFLKFEQTLEYMSRLRLYKNNPVSLEALKKEEQMTGSVDRGRNIKS